MSRLFAISFIALTLSAPAFGEDCTTPAAPAFTDDGANLTSDGYNAETEKWIAYEEATKGYRTCLNAKIDSREDGWLDALEAFNASAAEEEAVFAAYDEVSTAFRSNIQDRAARAAAEQTKASEAALVDALTGAQDTAVH